MNQARTAMDSGRATWIAGCAARTVPASIRRKERAATKGRNTRRSRDARPPAEAEEEDPPAQPEVRRAETPAVPGVRVVVAEKIAAAAVRPAAAAVPTRETCASYSAKGADA
ncbi:hypothetical protein HYZ98_02785 [Candidatus Peregrinibacteria bacterium]|nr:hypothetical protein [Candidatus Peregrinibacteria bacterium]